MNKKTTYQNPQCEVLEVEVEQCFAASNEGFSTGDAEDWDVTL